MKKVRSLVLGLLLLGGIGSAMADELRLVFVQSYRGAMDIPLYVRQPSGSSEANLRGIVVSEPIELNEVRRTVVVRDTAPQPVPGYYYRPHGEGPVVVYR